MSALEDLSAGRGRALLVEGEPGIGKTALMAAGLAAAEEAGHTVRTGTCDELSERLPLSVLFEALGVNSESAVPARARTGHAVRGGDGTGSVDRGGAIAAASGDPVAAAVERLLVLVDRLCAQGPLVLAVDDLQWADGTSLLVWRRLIRAVGQQPLLLVGTCRSVPQRAETDRLRRDLRDHGGMSVVLNRLGAPGVAELAGGLTGGYPPGPRLVAQLDLAAGNPLYVREMLDALTRANALEVQEGAIEVRAGAVADGGAAPGPGAGVMSPAEAIADRLDFLSADTRDVLRTAALFGSDFSVTDVSGVLGRPAAALAGPVREAVAAGVVESSGPRLRFRHGLLRQALYESLPAALRIALHRDAARSLIAANGPAERIAQLLLAAIDAADGWETDWVIDKAGVLARRAPVEAAALLEHASSHTREDDPRRPSLEDHLTSVNFLLARYDRAAEVARGVLARSTDPERRGRAVWTLGYVLLRTARPGEALTAVREVAAGLASGTPWYARLRAMEAMVDQASGRFEEGASTAAAALALGERLPDPMAVGYARHTLAMTCYARQDMQGCVEHISRGVDAIGTDPELLDLLLLLRTNQVAALSNLDRFGPAREVLGETRLLAERTGTSRLTSFTLLTGELACQTGDWDDALTEFAAVAAPDPAYAYLPVAAHGIAAVIAAHRDDRSLARHHLRAVEEIGDVPYRTNNLAYYFRARAAFAERDGDVAEVVTLLKEVVEPTYAVMDDRTTLLPLVARLALVVGDRALAGEALAILEAESDGSPLPRATAARDWCRGLLSGEPEPVLSAAAHYRTSGRRLEAAHTAEDAACLLAAGGDPLSAREALNEAMLTYTRLGARWDARRAAARLRQHGVRLGVRGARGRPRKGWEALTETESRIARLVALGRSNPDIAAELVLSRRTVETHVSHILAKLEVPSRREVADVAPAAGERPAAGRVH